jgi:hypothetical protein
MRVRLLLPTCVLGFAVTAAAQAPTARPTPQPGQPNRSTGGRPAEARPSEPRPADQPATARPSEQPSTARAPEARPQRREGQPVNVKIEFTITDQRTGSAAVKRTVSVTVADGFNGQIRSQSEVVGVGPVPLNIDAHPDLLTDGKLRLGFTLQYDWPAPVERADTGKPPIPASVEMSTAPRGTVMKTTMHNSVALVLESGKPTIAAQSADPIGDRQVTVEVKATVLR